jgi:probable rRNA maturation factor
MVVILNRQRKRPVRAAALRKRLEALAARHDAGDADVTVVVVGDRAMRTLNRRWRRKDRPTDVLSFSLRDATPDGRRYLGDIVIAAPTAFRQAKAGGRGLDREMEILAVHGLLHLLGLDHGRAMSRAEAEALQPRGET